jgi:hypothetical protein
MSTNPKIEKVKSDIEKAKSKILSYQAKLRDLERDKTRLENEQIVALVRKEMISDADLGTFMDSIRKGSAQAATDGIQAADAEIIQKEGTNYAKLHEN